MTRTASKASLPVAALIALSIATATFAQMPSALTIDLARQSPGVTNTETIAPGTYQAVIDNMVPGKVYQLTFNQQVTAIDPIDISAAVAAPDAVIYQCNRPLESLRESFADVDEEKQVPIALAGLRAAAADAGCTSGQLQLLEQTIDQETRDVRLQTITQGDQLTVTVVRIEGDARTTWKSVFSTGARGEWRVLYGFTFLPAKDDEFFTQPSTSEQGKFDILQATGNKDLDFAPSIFFHWLSAKRRNRAWSYGPVAGLGFDLEKPILFGGFGATYNENVMFTAGLVVHEQQRLDGRFNLTRPIGENLNSDQLTEGTYGVNFYFGVALRLGSNPFRRDSNGQQSGSQSP